MADRPSPLEVVLGVVGAGLAAIAVNLATEALPASLAPYRWLAWPLLIVLFCAAVAVRLRAPTGQAAAYADPARVREALIGRVRRNWVDGVLHRSLYRTARIELGLHVATERRHPWGLVTTPSGGAATTVAAGTRIGRVYDDLDETLLILGAPGSGKTTMLLELVDELLERADADDRRPVPVVFPLSSWASRRDPLDVWMARELVERYRIPADAAGRLARGDDLVPMLDGLDEVAAEHRTACVEAIEAYGVAHGTSRIVVCCRSADHALLRRPLAAYGTLRIEPLTRAQVEAFLDDAGPPLAPVRSALAADPGLWTLLESPLLLSIVALTYAGGPVPVAPTTTGGDRRRELFDVYVREMLTRHRDPRYPPESTQLRLAFLAAALRDQTVFRAELINRYSVPYRLVNRHSVPYRLRSLGRLANPAVRANLVAGVAVGGLTAAAAAWLIGWPAAIAASLVGLAASAESAERWDTSALAYSVRKDLTALARPSSTVASARHGLARLHYRRGAIGIPTTSGVVAGLVLGWSLGWLAIAGYAVAVAGSVSLALALVLGYAQEMLFLTPSPTERELPGPMASAVLRFGLVRAPVVAALTPVLPAAVVWATVSLDAAVRFGAVVAVGAGLFAITWLGGYAVLEQALVRRTLDRLGTFPLPARPFLDHAARCLLLRRVGGDHLFVHRELQDHFAARWDERTGTLREPDAGKPVGDPRAR
ncbi:MAG: NACHT domain-containing NTPase [Pseudonocardia sp.]